eukprot:1158326-Pelagomonas_calceolata.AAC.10
MPRQVQNLGTHTHTHTLNAWSSDRSQTGSEHAACFQDEMLDFVFHPESGVWRHFEICMGLSVAKEDVNAGPCVTNQRSTKGRENYGGSENTPHINSGKEDI